MKEVLLGLKNKGRKEVSNEECGVIVAYISNRTI